jgi:hypothetical protein
MSKEKVPYDSVPSDYSNEKLTDPHSSEQKDAYIEKMKQVYLPHSKENYLPSEESIERANGLDSSKPNPVADLISTKKE